jgi:hypothetical protein
MRYTRCTARVVAQHRDQGGKPHVRMGIETEVPEAAPFIGQQRVDR